MKAYNVECKCGEKLDRIFKGKEIVKCPKCGEIMVRIGGPLGGSDILPRGIGEDEKFVAYKSVALGCEIKTAAEMTKAYTEMWGETAPEEEKPKPKPEPEPRRPGRPRKTIIENGFVEDDKNEKDD